MINLRFVLLTSVKGYFNDTLQIEKKKLIESFTHFQQDDSSSFLYRSVHIHATEEQLLKLHKLADPDEIDGMLAEILSQSNFGATQLIKEYTMEATSSIWDNISFSFDIPPRTKEITTNFALLVFAYIVCRRYGINFMVVITFGVGYLLYEYLDYECHKVGSSALEKNGFYQRGDIVNQTN